MSASRAWLEFASDNLLPLVALNVEYVNVIHPVNSIISTKIDNLLIKQPVVDTRALGASPLTCGFTQVKVSVSR